MAARSALRCSTTHHRPSPQCVQHATSMAATRRMKACVSSRACGLAAGIASNRRACASRSVLAADVSTTMIYAHVLKVGGGAVRSPLDALMPA